MTEFKVASGLSNEVKDIRTKCEAINNSYIAISDDDVKTLDTSLSYIEQHKNIKDIIELYKSLVFKDVEDLNKMILEVEDMDKTLATNTTKQV